MNTPPSLPDQTRTPVSPRPPSLAPHSSPRQSFQSSKIGPTHTLADNNSNPNASLTASDSPGSGVFVQRPLKTCIKNIVYLATFLILPWGFYVWFITTPGGIAAPESLATLSTSSPRATTQVVTIVAAFLALLVQWAFGRAVTTFAKRRFQNLHSIFEIEVLSALKNGTIVWSWRRRGKIMLGTCVVVVFSVLLTSGFVALLSPLPITGTKEISAGRELDLASTLDSCYTWFDRTMAFVYPPDSRGNRTCGQTARNVNTGLTYTTCPLQDQYGEVLNAAKSSMISRFAPVLPIEHRLDAISSYTQLRNTRIIGATAGTLPTGPAGVSVFSSSAFPTVSERISSFNYTLRLQGIWADTSCSYVNSTTSQISVTQDPTSGIVSWQVQCPQESLQFSLQQRAQNAANGLILAGACHDPLSDSYTVHLKSIWAYSDLQDDLLNLVNPPPGNPRALPDPVSLPLSEGQARLMYVTYAGIDTMECTLAPRLGSVNATYQTDLKAFNMTHLDSNADSNSDPGVDSGYVPFREMGNITKTIVREAMWQTLGAISQGQTEWNGNMVGEQIRSVSIGYAGLEGQRKDGIVPNLVADALKGIFEYQVTHQRLILTAANFSETPQSCFRPVTGTLVQQAIGWDGKAATAIGLIPLVLIVGLGIVMIVLSMVSGGKLTVFDPTNPISLIAATRNGDIDFLQGKDRLAVGGPRDENVRSTRVRYGDHEGRWGLRSDA